MRISFLCTFEPHTAGGILTLGRARGAAANGHDVHVVFQPFKADRYVKRRSRPSGSHGKPVAGTVKITMAYSRFFSGGLLNRFFSLPKFILFDFPRVYRVLSGAEFAVIHKPLPLSFFYMVCLKLLGYRGAVCCVHSDWEGIGGYADLTAPEKVMRKLLVTFCEEMTPYVADVVWCASRTLYDRFGLAERLRPKRIYLSCGGEPFDTAPKVFDGGPRKAIYSGTYKSRPVIDFLVGTATSALRQSDRLRFVFLGTGPFLGELQERVARERGREYIECPGHVTHKRVLEYLDTAHYALLYLNGEYPETYTETSRSSTKLFEYLCAGTVIVASAIGEARELLAGREAAFLEENDPERFAARLAWLNRQPAGALADISLRASELFGKAFSHEVQMRTLVEFMKQRTERPGTEGTGLHSDTT